MDTRSPACSSVTSASVANSDYEDKQVIAPPSPPFDDGDIIIQTSDMATFRVFKLVLSLASPVFKDMFSLPQSPGKVEEGPPIIPVTETSETLDLLLRFCYPIVSPRLAEHDMLTIGGVLRAALKYSIDSVGESAREAFRVRLCASKADAVVGYSLACQLKLEEEARTAALKCLKWPIARFVVPELVLMSGLDYFNLLDYHERAGNAIAEVINQHNFFSSTCSIRTTFATHSWWPGSKYTIMRSFMQAPLGLEELSLSTIGSSLKLPNPCHECKDTVIQGWEQARNELVLAIEEKVLDIDLKISWR